MTYHVGDLIDGLHDKLTVQIARAMRHDAGFSHDCGGDIDFEALGQAKAILFLEELPELRRCWRSTRKPRSMATRPSRRSTKSFSAIPGSKPSRSIGSRMHCTNLRYR